MAETLDHYDPRGVFIVFDSTAVAVPQCRALAATDDNALHIVDQPGVLPEHRDDGLPVPLVLTAAHWLWSQGRQLIRLESWSDAAETVAIYEALGFALAEHEVSYMRDLRA